MRTTRIDVEGTKSGHYASITRKAGSGQIEAMILTPRLPDGETLRIAAGSSQEELWRFARDIQLHLDGRHGTGSDINEYFLDVQRFAD